MRNQIIINKTVNQLIILRIKHFYFKLKGFGIQNLKSRKNAEGKKTKREILYYINNNGVLNDFTRTLKNSIVNNICH